MKKLLLKLLPLALIVTGCAPSIAVISYLDVSKSAKENQNFSKQSTESCHGLFDGVQSGDLLTQRLVGSDQDALPSSPTRIEDPDLARGKCNQSIPTDGGQGTYLSSQLQQATDALKSSTSNLPTSALIAVEANEMDKFDPKVYQDFANQIHQKKGKVIFIGLTNHGNTRFGTNVAEALKNSPNIIYCSAEVRACVKDAIAKTRH